MLSCCVCATGGWPLLELCHWLQVIFQQTGDKKGEAEQGQRLHPHLNAHVRWARDLKEVEVCQPVLLCASLHGTQELPSQTFPALLSQI